MADNDEKMTIAAVMMAQAMGIDPGAIAIYGRTCPEGYEVRILIMPDESEQEAEMRNMVNDIFTD